MIIILLFIIGAIAGSLMNVCIYRMPRKESIISPRSHCPSCGKTIRWHDNIPVISFLLLRGKCRYCKAGISPRYVMVEVLSGLVCVFLFLRFGITWNFFKFLYLLDSLIVVSFIDFKTHEIPDSITISGILIGLLLAVLYPVLTGKSALIDSPVNSFLGVIAGGGSIYILGFIGEFIFKKEAMGGGDVKLLAMIGAFVGWKLAIFIFFAAPFFGVIPGIVLKLKQKRDVIPYGPYISLAAFVAIFWGETIIKKIFLI